MKLSCSGREDVERFFQILQNYKFDKVNIELYSSSLDEDMKKSLLYDFKKQGLTFQQHSLKEFNHEDSDNLQEEGIDLSTIAKDNLTEEDRISIEIEDKYLTHLMKDKDQKDYLAKYTKENYLEVNLTDRISFCGPRKPLENLVEKIKAFKYAISSDMPFIIAQSLKGTKHLKNLLDKQQENKIFAKIIRHEDGEKSNLVFFGGDQEVVSKLAQEVNQMVKNLLIVFELSTRSENPEVIQKINEYLEGFVQGKCQGVEFNSIESKNSGKQIFYVYIEDSKKQNVEQIKKFLDNKLGSICFLTVTPHKRSSFSLNPTGISQDEPVNIVNLSDCSYLMIGKAKYLKKKVRELLLSEKAIEGVYDYFLRFKRITHPNGEKVKTTQFINNTLAVTVQSDASLYGFKIFKSPEEIQKILEKLEIIVRNKKQSTGSGTIKMNDMLEETKTEEKNEVLFPKENQTETFFDIGDIQPGDGLSLEEETDEFKKLAKLLQKDYPQANIKEITKCHLEDQWKMYLNYRKEKSKEYIGFIDSQDSPMDIMENYKPYPERTIRPSFNPSIHSCPKSEDEFVLCACTVLVAANDPKKIISYYPAYFISFI